MKIVQRFILFFFVCGALNLNAQASIFACLENGDIALIDPNDCSSKILSNNKNLKQINFSYYFDYFTDITYSNGYLYGIYDDLYVIDLSNNEIKQIQDTNFHGCMGLASDNRGNLYGSGDNLIKYNLESKQSKILGKLTNLTEGDIELKNDVIYVTTFDSVGNYLSKIKTNPFSDTVISILNADMNFGLTNFPDLAKNELYFSKVNDLFVLNLNTGEEKLKCPNIVEHVIFGLTSGPSTLSINNLSLEIPFNLIQNSDAQQLTITLNEPKYTYSGYVLNSLGEEILDLGVITDTKTINLSDLSNGLYFVKIVSSENSYFKKFYK